MNERLLSIGEVAAATSCTVTAIRYYDELGLIAAAKRIGGKRQFDAGTIAAVRLIREMQRCGFSLGDVREMLAGGDWRTAVDDKLLELGEQQRRIEQVMTTLGDIRDCGCASLTTCGRLADSFGDQ